MLVIIGDDLFKVEVDKVERDKAHEKDEVERADEHNEQTVAERPTIPLLRNLCLLRTKKLKSHPK